MNVGNDVGAVP